MMMKIMAETKLGQTPICERTVNFVKRIQHPDGFWDENPALISYNPPFWDQPGQLITQLWLTGALADTLTRLEEGASQEVERARKFLLQYRQDDGRFKGPLITTWLAIAVFAPAKGVNDPIVETALAILKQHTNWEAPDLSWALECLYWAGIPKDNPTITQLLSMLISQQKPDGYWEATDESTNPVQTILQCLIVLKQFDRL
jgi:hypothetical protein